MENTTSEVTQEREGVWENLGVVVAQRRELLGLSKSEASRRAEISQTTWRLIEHGKHDSPATSTLVRIARALEMDPYEMLTLAGRRGIHPSDPSLAGAARIIQQSGRSWGEASQEEMQSAIAQVDDWRSHDEAFVNTIENNPRLDEAARAALLQVYYALVDPHRVRR